MVNYRSIPTLTPEQSKRFWSKVDKSAGPDGCWLWTGSRYQSGYSRFLVYPHYFSAHRVAYTLMICPICKNDGLYTVTNASGRQFRDQVCGCPAGAEYTVCATDGCQTAIDPTDERMLWRDLCLACNAEGIG